jgi:chromosome segregation ATPase
MSQELSLQEAITDLQNIKNTFKAAAKLEAVLTLAGSAEQAAREAQARLEAIKAEEATARAAVAAATADAQAKASALVTELAGATKEHNAAIAKMQAERGALAADIERLTLQRDSLSQAVDALKTAASRV